MAIRFVALDLGNVLCDLQPEAFKTALAGVAGTSVERVEQAFDDALHHALERGDATAADFFQGMTARLGGAMSQTDFERCWNALPVPRPGADALVARLQVPHAIWSNTDPIHASHLARSLAAIPSATHRHFSFTARSRKPEAAYFLAGLQALGAAPHEVLFVDDRPENLAGAASLGIVVEAALTLPQVEGALSRHGMLKELA